MTSATGQTPVPFTLYLHRIWLSWIRWTAGAIGPLVWATSRPAPIPGSSSANALPAKRVSVSLYPGTSTGMARPTCL